MLKRYLELKPESGDVSAGHVSAAKYESVCVKLMKQFPRAKKVIITLRGSINADHNTWSGVLFDGKNYLKHLNIR